MKGKNRAAGKALLLLLLAALLAGVVALRARQRTGTDAAAAPVDFPAAEAASAGAGAGLPATAAQGEGGMPAQAGSPAGESAPAADANVDLPGTTTEAAENAESPEPAENSEGPEPSDAADDRNAPAAPESDPVPAEEAVAALPAAGAETPAQGKKEYTEETYKLVTDMVYAYRNLGRDGWPQVEAALESLRAVDPQLCTLWNVIMTEWDYVSNDLPVNRVTNPEALPENLKQGGSLSETEGRSETGAPSEAGGPSETGASSEAGGLPRDDSLCIIVMGYHLTPDGEMEQEMRGRCEVALALAREYPGALLALTGGGTASRNPEATEADVMAAWFRKQGIAEERMIIENRSQTTGQNAKNTCAILTTQNPQVKELLVVSSDYHIPQCTLLLTEAAQLIAWENGLASPPFAVAANAAYPTAGSPEYNNPANLWTDLWTLADPHY